MSYNPAAEGRPLNIPEAIARQEGWNMGASARCRRNNNPGNLEYEEWQWAFGAVPEAPTNGHAARFAHFPSTEQGFKALVHLCGFPRYKGQTLANLIEAWAPPFENRTTQYLRNVCAWCELPPDAIIDGHLAEVE